MCLRAQDLVLRECCGIFTESEMQPQRRIGVLSNRSARPEPAFGGGGVGDHPLTGELAYDLAS